MIIFYRTLFFVALAISLFPRSSSSSSPPSTSLFAPPTRQFRNSISRLHGHQQQRGKNYYSASSSNAAFVISLVALGSNKIGARNKCDNFVVKRGNISEMFPSFHHHQQRSNDPKCFSTNNDASKTTTATTTTTTTTTTTSGSSSSTWCYTGGEYAGVYTTHSSLTGKLIPVPDHYVPEAMKEWDMIPSYFECLLSDELQQEQQQENGIVASSIQRRTATILPEVGCGVDNLDVLSTVDTTTLVESEGETRGNKEEGSGNIHLFGEGDDDKVITFDKFSSSIHRNKRDLLRKRIETMFYLPISTNGNNEDGNDLEEKTQQRLRVAFDILPTKGVLHDKITLSLERSFPNGVFGVDKAKSVSDLIDGGGLDGRTVSKLIGGDILDYAKSLRDEEEEEMDGKITFQYLVGRWKRLRGAKEEDVEMSVEDWKKMDTIFLPGNLIIRHGAKDGDDRYWQVEVSRVAVSEMNSNPQRVGVRRTYATTLVDSHDTPEYFAEEKL